MSNSLLSNYTFTEIFKAVNEEPNLNKAAKRLGVFRQSLANFVDKYRGEGSTALKDPKIFILDIETAPDLAYVWGRWKQNIPQVMVEEEGGILTWAGKWFDSSTVVSDTCNMRTRNDKKLLELLRDYLDKADIVVGHNMRKFDIRKINARFIIHGIPKPSPYKIVDTLLVSRKHFGFNSHKLDDICSRLGIENKVSTSFSLWRGCMQGNTEAFDTMLSYNEQDVVITGELYNKLLPYIDSHPNLSAMKETVSCPKCGSEEIEETGKSTLCISKKYPLYVCKCCGGHCKRVGDILSNCKEY